MKLTSFRPAIAALMIGVGFGTMVALLVPTYTDAAMLCTFPRNLSVGMYGDDVRCLQQYLNSNGSVVATYGSGAPGNETPTFGPLTQAAVARWQAAHGYPVTGVFVVSYLTGAGTTVSNVYPNDSYNSGQNTSTSAQNALSDIHDIRDDYNDTLSDYFDAVDDGESVGSARSYLEDTLDEIWDAYDSFTSGDYRSAQEYVNDAQNDLENAQDELGTGHHNNNNNDTRADAADALNDANNAIADARREINRSDSSSSAIDRAEEDLDNAKDSYNDALDAYDDHDYSEAIDRANDAEDYANNAIDEL